MRICIVYDCLYPYTVGGAERWYRNLAERLAGEGHDVTYLTLRQWGRREHPRLRARAGGEGGGGSPAGGDGGGGSAAGGSATGDAKAGDATRGRVAVVNAGPRMALYTGGRRRILPPLVFGVGVLWHLLRHGRRYDVVHTASFPYFSLLAAGAVRPLRRFELVVDWHEVWSRSYWREYLGALAGPIGYAVQLLCARIRQRAFCFSQLHAKRLRAEGLHGEVTVLRGQYAGAGAERVADETPSGERPPLVLFAGRLIPEKRVVLAVAAVAAAAQRIAGLRAVFYGEGPERARLAEAIDERGLRGVISAPGFAPAETLAADMRRASCMLLTSRREGYGMVVVEASAAGTPSIVVSGEDNAATELIDDGVNGVIVDRAGADAIADAIVRVQEAGPAMRESTAAWFAKNAPRLSLERSLETVLGIYGGATPT
jgi:glycosyltransferase involved in cell wall biosynthesis